MFKNLLVGVDAREGGRDAIALAQRLAEPDGEVTLAYVYSGDVRAWRGSSAACDAAEREVAPRAPSVSNRQSTSRRLLQTSTGSQPLAGREVAPNP